MDPTFILIAVAVAAMWFMTSRTRKQQKEQVAFRDLLEPGQYVMTGSGMFGTVVAVEADAVIIESSPGVTSRWLKIAVAKLAEPPVAADDDLDAEGDEYDDEAYDDEAYDDEAYDDEAYEESDEPEERQDAADVLDADEPQDDGTEDGPEAQAPADGSVEDGEPETDQRGARR
jgi:preprotein translocase subunit YajC